MEKNETKSTLSLEEENSLRKQVADLTSIKVDLKKQLDEKSALLKNASTEKVQLQGEMKKLSWQNILVKGGVKKDYLDDAYKLVDTEAEDKDQQVESLKKKYGNMFTDGIPSMTTPTNATSGAVGDVEAPQKEKVFGKPAKTK